MEKNVNPRTVAAALLGLEAGCYFYVALLQDAEFQADSGPEPSNHGGHEAPFGPD